MSEGDEVSAEQRAYAASILAYRLAEQQVQRVAELHAQAVHMAEVLRGRMEQARQERQIEDTTGRSS